jgi:Ca2+-binding RTX toxin-like protein
MIMANPVAVDDSWFISNATALLPAERLLANDSDADSDALTVTSVINGTNGTVSLVAGVIQFNPAGGATTASFDYTVADGNGGTAIGTVTIDIVNTNSKDDVVTVPASADFAYINAKGGRDSVVGGDGPDTLIGSVEYDTLDGAGGDDHLIAGAGGGSVRGGDGDDTIDLTDPGSVGRGEGGAGSDTIFGGGKSSFLDGGPGIDVMHGGGRSIIVVDDPNDVALAPAKVIYSTAVSYATEDIRNLYLFDGAIDGTGGHLSNHILGNTADNALLGLGRPDRLRGEGGNDTLDGGTGGDTLIGGAGDDFIDGGIGTQNADTASYDGFEAVVVSLAIATAQDTGGAGIDTLARIENLIGGNGNDQLTGDAGRNRLEGGAGHDTLTGGASNDDLDGGDGQDTVVFAGNSDDYEITFDDDVVTVRDLAPLASGDDGTDTLVNVEELRFLADIEFSL